MFKWTFLPHWSHLSATNWSHSEERFDKLIHTVIQTIPRPLTSRDFLQFVSLVNVNEDKVGLYNSCWIDSVTLIQFGTILGTNSRTLANILRERHWTYSQLILTAWTKAVFSQSLVAEVAVSSYQEVWNWVPISVWIMKTRSFGEPIWNTFLSF